MDNSEIIGIIAGIATTVSFMPQAYKVYTTKRTHDLSGGMFLLLAFGLCMWTLYGVQHRSVSIIVANSVTLALTLYILVMKLRHG